MNKQTVVAGFTIPQPNCTNFPKSAYERFGFSKRWFRRAYRRKEERRTGNIVMDIHPAAWDILHVYLNGCKWRYIVVKNEQEFYAALEALYWEFMDTPKRFDARRELEERNRRMKSGRRERAK